MTAAERAANGHAGPDRGACALRRIFTGANDARVEEVCRGLCRHWDMWTLGHDVDTGTSDLRGHQAA